MWKRVDNPCLEIDQREENLHQNIVGLTIQET